MRSPGEQNCIREGRGGLKVFLSLLLGTVAIPTPGSCSLLTLNEKKDYGLFGRRRRLITGIVYGGTRWTNQTLLFQSMLRRVKRLKPFLSVAIFPFLRFFKLNMSIEIKHKY